MHRLFVSKEHDAQVPAFHFRYLYPPADAAIGLNDFSQRSANCSFYPFVLNDRAVCPRPDSGEVARELH